MPPRHFILGVILLLLAAAPSAFAAATAAAATRPAYAPLPVPFSAAPADGQGPLPLITIGRLPAGAASPVNRWTLDAAYYASFLDNQVGWTHIDDPHAAGFAVGKLKLLPARDDAEIVLAVAIPNIPDASATVGPLLRNGQSLTLTIHLWQAGEHGRAKTINAQRTQLLYAPPLPAGAYRLQVQWDVMSPLAKGSNWTWTDFKVAEVPFEMAQANQNRGPQPAAPPTLAFDALKPVPMPKPPADAQTQSPWLMTARWFADIGDAQEGLAVGTCEPFQFLRGDPGPRQPATALPRLQPPVAGEKTYARILAPQRMTAEWATVEGIYWTGNTATIQCRWWTDTGERSKNIASHPMLLVSLTPPTYVPASPQITPPGKYKVKVEWQKLVATHPGGWYVEEGRGSEEVEFEVGR